MVILGLGSNTGDRLHHLREAKKLLEQVPRLKLLRLSPLYLSNALLPEGAPSSWNQPHINLAILCETTLSPQDLLHQIKNIEYALGRRPDKKRWSPRDIDIDILAWDDRELNESELQIPHAGLSERPFALWPLADLAPYWIHPSIGKTATELSEAWGSRFSGEAPLNTKQIAHRIDTPRIVGILNLSPDSFSDGGNFPSPQKALRQAYHLASSGAEVIDLGAEATNPMAMDLDPEDEWDRLEPVLLALKSERQYMSIPPKISVDTRNFEVAEKALKKGVDWINDVSGLEDPRMQALLAAFGREAVVMHNLGIPASKAKFLPRHQDPVEAVYQWAEERLNQLEKNGLKRRKLIFDVGLGFGKEAAQSFALLKNIERFRSLGVRLLVGHSRKSFMQLFTNKKPEERDLETAIFSNYLATQEVDYLRVHEVESCARGFKILKSLG